MPNPLRLAARALTGSTYAILGLDAVRAPGARIAKAAPILATLRTVLALPEDDETVVLSNAAVQTVVGALLAVGVVPRLSAALLIGSLTPTTMAGHAFWTIDDPAVRNCKGSSSTKTWSCSEASSSRSRAGVRTQCALIGGAVARVGLGAPPSAAPPHTQPTRSDEDLMRLIARSSAGSRSVSGGIDPQTSLIALSEAARIVLLHYLGEGDLREVDTG